MKITRERLLRGTFHLFILGLIGYLIFGFTRPTPATVALDDKTYRITGPYVHQNLAVYLIHADSEDERSFITLDEGLKSGVVKVTEKRSAQVNELTIDNTGDDYLFLQEGDRVKGGQQDRTIYTSLVVPPHSGQMPLPAFCVEPHRWVAGAQGMQFSGTANPAVCPKEIRLAAKVGNNQGQVWAAVAQQKQACVANGLSSNTNSSLNESLDAPKVKRIAEEFAQALNGVIEEHEDALGVVIAINGRVEEVNFYPNRQLLGKQYPRLVQSYSLAATLKQKEATNCRTLSDVEVGRFVWDTDQNEKKVALALARPAQPSVLEVFDERIQENADNDQHWGMGLQLPRNLAIRIQQARVSTNEASIDAAAIQITERQNIRRDEMINAGNRMEIVEQAAVVNCKTEYHGKLVHRQYLTRNKPVVRRAVQANQVEQNNNNDAGQQLSNQPIGNGNLRNVRQNIAPQQSANPGQQGQRNP